MEIQQSDINEKMSKETEQRDSQAELAENAQGLEVISMRKILAIGAVVGIVFSTLILFAAPVLREWKFALLPADRLFRENNVQTLKQELRDVTQSVASLRRKNAAFTPRTPYLVVNTSEDKFYLMKGRETIRQGICSTGSYVHLKASDNRQWVFKTPRGLFWIQGKLEAPVWRMPDWAFIEEGRPVPPPDSPERYEAGVLGEYALSLGKGYLIHGTLYKRFLGMPVTHGCVRLDDEDLESVYKNLQIGSKVFIY